jgi:hypothetical protein
VLPPGKLRRYLHTRNWARLLDVIQNLLHISEFLLGQIMNVSILIKASVKEGKYLNMQKRIHANENPLNTKIVERYFINYFCITMTKYLIETT